LDVPGFINNFDFQNWQEWAAPLAGLVSGLMALFTGQAWLRSRRRPKPPPSEKQGQLAPDPFVFGSASEKRVALRRTGQPTRVTIYTDAEEDKRYEAWVVDRSVGGLCLVVQHPFPEGTILNVRANHAPPQVPYVKVEVKRSQSSGDGYELGCQFLKTPTWNILLLFG
jgi:PilZ domain